MNPTSKFPWINLCVDDLTADTTVLACSPATRAIWVWLFCAMHREGRCGVISGTTTQLARIASCSDAVMKRAIEELTQNKTGIVTTCNGVVTIVNRRMKREADERKRVAARVVKHRANKAKRESNATVTETKRDCNANVTAHNQYQYHNQEEEAPPTPSKKQPRKNKKEAAEEPEIQVSPDALRFGQVLADIRAKRNGGEKATPDSVKHFSRYAGKILAEASVDRLGLVCEYLADPAGDSDWSFGLGNIARGYRSALVRNFASILTKAEAWQRKRPAKPKPPHELTPEEAEWLAAEEAKGSIHDTVRKTKWSL